MKIFGVPRLSIIEGQLEHATAEAQLHSHKVLGLRVKWIVVEKGLVPEER